MNTDELCAANDTTPRQIRHWVRLGLLPDQRDSTGPGVHHDWSDADARCARFIAALVTHHNLNMVWIPDALALIRRWGTGWIVVSDCTVARLPTLTRAMTQAMYAADITTIYPIR